MPGEPSHSPCLPNDKTRLNPKQHPLAAASLAALLALASMPVLSQEVSDPIGSQNLLPATTGDPLTVKPTNTPDIQCSVLRFTNVPPKPVLTLLCPPSDVFAPLHVFIRLSWLNPADAPVYSQGISVLPNSPTKLRTSKTAVLVRLNVYEKGKGQPEAKWVSFTGVVDVALLTEPRDGRPLRERTP